MSSWCWCSDLTHTVVPKSIWTLKQPIKNVLHWMIKCQTKCHLQKHYTTIYLFRLFLLFFLQYLLFFFSFLNKFVCCFDVLPSMTLTFIYLSVAEVSKYSLGLQRLFRTLCILQSVSRCNLHLELCPLLSSCSCLPSQNHCKLMFAESQCCFWGVP